MRDACCTSQYRIGARVAYATVALLSLLIGSLPQLGHAQVLGTPTQGEPVTPQVFEGDLSTLPPVVPTPLSQTRETPIGDGVPLPPDIVLPIPPPKGIRDELLLPEEGRPEGALGVTPPTFTTPNPNFAGVSNINGVAPADPVGAVGRNHFIQMVNDSFQIFDKQGNSLAGPSNMNSLWAGFGGNCQNRNDGDPYVLYDHLADRWVLSQLAIPNGFATPPTPSYFPVQK